MILGSICKIKLLNHLYRYEREFNASIEERAKEIVDGMTSCTKEVYFKQDVLPELLALQTEIISVAFPGANERYTDLTINDVENCFYEESRGFGNIATREFRRFESGCKELVNCIKSEISGKRGETETIEILERLECKKHILQNVELVLDDQRTEIDAIVITEKGVFIIETKNSKRDIFVDENGDYYKTGEYLYLDQNIVEKLDKKEQILRLTLENNGIKNPKIKKIVVFPNNRITVRNTHRNLTTCFLNMLPSFIEDKQQAIYDENDMEMISKVIENARTEEAYPLGLDVEQFKWDFAHTKAVLEFVMSKNGCKSVHKADRHMLRQREFPFETKWDFYWRIRKGMRLHRHSVLIERTVGNNA